MTRGGTWYEGGSLPPLPPGAGSLPPPFPHQQTTSFGPGDWPQCRVGNWSQEATAGSTPACWGRTWWRWQGGEGAQPSFPGPQPSPFPGCTPSPNSSSSSVGKVSFISPSLGATRTTPLGACDHVQIWAWLFLHKGSSPRPAWRYHVPRTLHTQEISHFLARKMEAQTGHETTAVAMGVCECVCGGGGRWAKTPPGCIWGQDRASPSLQQHPLPEPDLEGSRPCIHKGESQTWRLLAPRNLSRGGSLTPAAASGILEKILEAELIPRPIFISTKLMLNNAMLRRRDLPAFGARRVGAGVPPPPLQLSPGTGRVARPLRMPHTSSRCTS